MEAKPNFFIIGCPRSGTTSLHYYLNQHPQIFMSDPKEPAFFGEDLTRSTHLRFQHFSQEEYLALFDNTADYPVRGEATSITFLSASAVHEIKQFSPDAKVIMLVRDPLDAAYSYYQLKRRNGREPEKDFMRAFKRTLVQSEALLATNSILERTSYLHYIVRMPAAIREYQEIFGENFKVVLFDKLKTDTYGTLQDVFGFLGVDESFQPDISKQNVAYVLRSTLLHCVLKPAYLLRPITHRLFGGSLGIVRGVVEWNRKEQPYPSLSPELRQKLLPLVAKEYDELSELLGHDFNG